MSMSMSMEAWEESTAAPNSSSSSSENNNGECPHAVVKGKRTKRQRVLQSTAALSSGSSSGGVSGEEEDLALCLILLARGEGMDKQEAKSEEEGAGGGVGEKFSSRRIAEAPTTTDGKAGFYVYECKTCNKCFPSFQALGGHRSSHKKPKMAQPAAGAMMEEKGETEEKLRMNILSSPQMGANSSVNSKTRVHECSICGLEFSSGQALGGHMRRHRAATAAAVVEPQKPKKEKSILSLDLNLPAPSDEERGNFRNPPPSLPFAGNQPLVFSASALVDCHY